MPLISTVMIRRGSSAYSKPKIKCSNRVKWKEKNKYVITANADHRQKHGKGTKNNIKIFPFKSAQLARASAELFFYASEG